MNDRHESPLWQLVLARWRSFYREPSTLFWAFVFPIILVCGCQAYAYRAIVDERTEPAGDPVAA